jgi:muramidase (phage lysozyme)
MSWEDATGSNPNVTRFLDFLAKAEGADWDTIVGGSKFSDFSQHPNVVGLRTKEGPSTAAGRYQITGTTYRDVAPKIGVTDFSQESQNKIAIELIRRKGALEDVLSGNYEPAIQKLGSVWASLPSSPYKQPKRDWNFVKANLMASTGNDGWETINPAAPQASNDGWETIAPVAGPQPAPAQTVAAPKTAAQVVQAATKKEEPRGVLRRVDDFVRGAADTLTFGYADEIAAKLDSLVGGGQSGKKAYDESLAAQRQRDKEGGVERVVGQVGGALAPTVGVIRAVDGATRLARAGAGAATGLIQGGLYGSGSADGDLADRAKGAAVGAGTGAVLGGALGAVIPATLKQKGNAFVKTAGGDDAARLDAEIIRDIKKLSDSSTQRGNPITAVQLNAVEGKYVSDVQQALTKLGKTQDVSPLREALQNRRALTPDDLAPLRSTKAGEAVADAIEKAQRARSLTQPMQSSGGALPLLREGVDYLPVPAGVNRGLKALLGGRQTREVAAQKALKQAGVADDVLARLGPSRATQSLDDVQRLALEAQQAQASKVAAGKAGKAARVAKEANPQTAISELQAKDPTYILGLGNRLGSPRNATEMAEFSGVIKNQMEARIAQQAAQAAAAKEAKAAAALVKSGGKAIDPKLQVLQDTRRPLSGAFQEILPGGRSNLNLNSDEAIDALRLVSRQFKDRPVGQAAKDILKSGNVADENAFYGLQNQLRKLQEQGVLGNRGGALTEATASSGIRNPMAYQQAIKTADAARELAVSNAPNKAMAQFANTVANATAPAQKMKLIEDRLAKTSDPAIREYLETLVKPLAEFGAKAKK